MRRILVVLLLAAALLLAAVHDRAQQQPAPPRPQEPAPQQSPQKIVREINLVDVLFTVLNRRNKLVADLDKESFKVTDEGIRQDIGYFSRQSDLPLRIGMLLDTSNSIRDRIQFEKDAAVNFLFNVVRRGRDQSFVMTFDDRPYVQQSFTDDTGRLRDEIVKMKAGGGTAIYDAVYEACKNQ